MFETCLRDSQESKRLLLVVILRFVDSEGVSENWSRVCDLGDCVDHYRNQRSLGLDIDLSLSCESILGSCAKLNRIQTAMKFWTLMKEKNIKPSEVQSNFE